jgi:hypothetical protein
MSARSKAPVGAMADRAAGRDLSPASPTKSALSTAPLRGISAGKVAPVDPDADLGGMARAVHEFRTV